MPTSPPREVRPIEILGDSDLWIEEGQDLKFKVHDAQVTIVLAFKAKESGGRYITGRASILARNGDGSTREFPGLVNLEAIDDAEVPTTMFEKLYDDDGTGVRSAELADALLRQDYAELEKFLLNKMASSLDAHEPMVEIVPVSDGIMLLVHFNGPGMALSLFTFTFRAQRAAAEQLFEFPSTVCVA